MANLYLTEQNSILRKTGDRLIVQKGEEILLEVQCHKIDAVLIFGNVQFTTQAVHELFEHGIEMAILTRTGKLIGQITSPATKNIELRLQQFKKYWDNDFKLILSKSIVAGKIKNGLQVIRQFSYNHPEIALDREIDALKSRLRDVESATQIGQLFGLEGSAAHAYFDAFGKMLLGEFHFPGRKKHPSTDPVNALLSLTYTMIFQEISSLLDGLGFDPYLGYYHTVDYGRASLASDLMEEFRAPLADRFTLKLVNNRIFQQEDFYTNPEEGVYLKRESLKRYFVEYEGTLHNEFIHPETQEKTTHRKCFRLQAEKLASCIQQNSPYLPFEVEI
ncbi:MAG: CRISPR-associated endonuclease Cas1 [Planctomycetia bacterium]|nr:MAG: CRISPR-associated endonuclease Cas1 [Planctomycetia bacterium]HQU32623.1 CRISPR-associated endonuclease Cas1 [Candidatus Brocadia sapporoensis]